MKALDILLYLNWLLTLYESSPQIASSPIETQEHILHMYILYLELEKIECLQSKRKFWVRPIFSVQRRRAQGASDNLVFEMETEDKEQYLKYLRITKKMFYKLLKKVQPHIKKKYVIRKPIPTHTRLHICLRYLASGDSMESIAYQFRVGHNTVSKIVRETCRAIWISLKGIAFPRLTKEGWLSHARSFEEKWNFPHCIGAIDGKLVVMQAPPNSGSQYYSYKSRFSMNLMAISDAHYRFIALDIGAPGRRSDGGVFAESVMFKKFSTNTFDVPKPEAINANTPALPYVLVADEAFSLTSYCMRPYPRSKQLNIKKKVFNYRLSRARRMVESAFGILTARWRIYRKEIIGSTTLVKRIIQATTCLHNWIITESLSNPENNYQYTHLTPVERLQPVNGLQSIPTQNEMAQQTLNNPNENTVRNNFADYFVSPEGSLSWQYEKVLQNDF